MYSLKTLNVVIVTCGVLLAIAVIAVFASIANNNADRHRERSEHICVQAGYEWVDENCMYPPGTHR